MTALTIPGRRLRDLVRPGDRIVAIDGSAKEPPLIVHGDPFQRAGAIRLVNPLGTATVWNLYPDTQVRDEVVVERDEPERTTPEPLPAELPANSPHRLAVRSLPGGVRLLSDGDGFWASDDGRWQVHVNDGYLTECENPHPVRLTAALAKAVRENPNLFPEEAQEAVWGVRPGYRCPGGHEHSYSLWVVWDETRGDYLGGDAGGFTTFTDAYRALVRHLTGETS